MDNRTEILDLRTALQVLRGEEGQLIETDVPVDTMAELSGVYRKGFPEASAVIGILGSRKRTGLLLGCPPESLGQLLCECAQNPIPPVVSREKASCQEVVHYAYEEGFDLRRLLPAPTNTPVDAGGKRCDHTPHVPSGKRGAVHFFHSGRQTYRGYGGTGRGAGAVSADIHQHRRGSGYLPHFLL